MPTDQLSALANRLGVANRIFYEGKTIDQIREVLWAKIQERT